MGNRGLCYWPDTGKGPAVHYWHTLCSVEATKTTPVCSNALEAAADVGPDRVRADLGRCNQCILLPDGPAQGFQGCFTFPPGLNGLISHTALGTQLLLQVTDLELDTSCRPSLQQQAFCRSLHFVCSGTLGRLEQVYHADVG